MLRVSGEPKHIDQVLMPTECLTRFRGNQHGESIDGHDFYWAIEITPPNERVAHLILPEQREQYRRPGIRSIIPAYRKAQ
jgi:hypothetical protein